jgi:hypothetical protein
MIWDGNPHALYKMTQKSEGARLGVMVWIAFLDGRPVCVRCCKLETDITYSRNNQDGMTTVPRLVEVGLF